MPDNKPGSESDDRVDGGGRWSRRRRTPSRWDDLSIIRKVGAVVTIPLVLLLLTFAVLVSSADAHRSHAVLDAQLATMGEGAYHLFLGLVEAGDAAHDLAHGGDIVAAEPIRAEGLDRAREGLDRLDGIDRTLTDRLRHHVVRQLADAVLSSLAAVEPPVTVDGPPVASLAPGHEAISGVLQQQIELQLGDGWGRLQDSRADADRDEQALRWFTAVLLLGAALVLLAVRTLGGRFADRVVRLQDDAGLLANGAALEVLEEDWPDDELGRCAAAVHRASRLLARRADQATAASRATTAFLANVSHEMRTPMNGVLGMTALLNVSELDAEQRQHVGIIRSSAESMVELLNELLDATKVQAGTFGIREEVHNPGEVISEAVDLFEGMAADKSIDLSLHLEPDLPELVLGDPQRLRQIVLNLVGNAVKFTDGGRVLVSAGVRPADDGRTLSVAVFDTGGGIPADMVDVIFDSFVQAHEDDSAVATGTGLGLSIAKKLVERMGGTIGVRSSVGVGSCFWFVLPFAEVTNQPAPALPAGSDPAFEVSDTPLRLLVADDNEINRRVARGLLGALGHEVLLVGDGREAVEMVRSVPVDAVFMDAQMPIMDGLEATAAIRALPGPESATPIIAMTASALDADRDRFLAGGMDDCAFKPLVWDDLRAVLERTVISRPDATTAEDDHHEPGQDPLDQRILHGLVLLHRSGQRLDELLDGFELRARERLREITAAAARGDAHTVALAAHSLRGSSGNLAAGRLASMAERLELSAEEGDLDVVEVLVRSMREELVLVMHLLRATFGVPTGVG